MEDALSFGFDLETTSANHKTAGVVQLCLLAEQGGIRRPLMNTLVRSPMAIPDEASRIHGIYDRHVQGMPDQAIAAWTVALLCETMQPKFIVGFNSKSYDEPLIDRCLGSRVFKGALSLDVLDVAYRFYPELDGHKLGVLYKHFFWRELEGAHDASADVVATLDILAHIEKGLGKTREQLATEMQTPRPYDIFPISKKYKGWKASEVPKSMARWLLETSAKEDNPLRPDLLAAVEMILSR